MPIRLVLADDHQFILDGLESLFRLEEDFEVVARCIHGEETLQAVRQHRPDILILDIRMPGKDGLAIARAIRSEGLPTRIVLLTAELDEDQLLEAVRLGVRGIVLKEMAPQLLVECIHAVQKGGQWLERNSTQLALAKVLKRADDAREIATLLTARETELVRMIAGGLRNKEIADRLFISEGTVKVHLHNIYEKLGIDGRLALMRFALDKGLI
jgi:DNA-binding NarL/FixJ family response regulator